MRVGTCLVHLRVTNSLSLKDKRQVVKGLIDRLRRSFNVSVAEVGLTDKWREAEVAFACVSSSAKRANQVLSKATDQIERNPEVEVVSVELEID
jgi:uncharacterized protein YlxP (DUF503 family)